MFQLLLLAKEKLQATYVIAYATHLLLIVISYNSPFCETRTFLYSSSQDTSSSYYRSERKYITARLATQDAKADTFRTRTMA